MNFARMARMSPKQRMMAALRGKAMPTQGLEVADGQSGRYSPMQPAAGLGLTLAPVTAPEPMTITPIQTAPMSIQTRIDISRSVPVTFRPDPPPLPPPAASITPISFQMLPALQTLPMVAPPPVTDVRPKSDVIEIAAAEAKEEKSAADLSTNPCNGDGGGGVCGKPLDRPLVKPMAVQIRRVEAAKAGIQQVVPIEVPQPQKSGVSTWLWIAGAAVLTYLAFRK